MSWEQISHILDIAHDARLIFPRHTVKRLAHLLGVPIGTARHWLYGTSPIPEERKAEAYLAMREEVVALHTKAAQLLHKINTLEQEIKADAEKRAQDGSLADPDGGAPSRLGRGSAVAGEAAC